MVKEHYISQSFYLIVLLLNLNQEQQKKILFEAGQIVDIYS